MKPKGSLVPIISFKEIFFFFLYCESSVVVSVSGPEFMKVPLKVTTFTNNTGTRLECFARGDPQPSISWLGLDQALIHTIPNVREVWPNGTLMILPFSASQYRADVHAGQYQCRSANSVGTILAPPVTLRAVVVQEMEVRLYDEHVTAGNTAMLSCVIPSFLRDFVSVTSWEKDSTTHIYPSLHGDGKYHVVPDGRLLVHRVRASDSHMNYRCRVLHALTGNTAISNVARIIVNEPGDRFAPRMITKSTSLHSEIDLPLVIPCVAHAYPLPNYRWFLKKSPNGDLIPLTGGDDNVFRGFKSTNHDGVLVIPIVQKDMMPQSTTTLICEASNEDGSSTMDVNVKRSTISSVNVTPKLLIVDAASSGEFRCTVSGETDSAAISWFRNGEKLNPMGKLSLSRGGTALQINGVNSATAGMFQCFVQTETQMMQSSAELRLGASPPEFIYRFIQQTLTPGPSVSLKCIAKASPTPVFEWLLDGFPLPHSDRFLVGQYVTLSGEVVSHVNISRTKVIDGGEYTCKAQNSVGEIVHSAPLYIYGAPHIRSMGTLTAISGEAFRVRCPVAGYPTPIISWNKGGRSLPLNRRHKATGPLLEIEDVSRESDEGDYTCVASDRHGRRVTQRVTIKVVERPKVFPFSIPEALIAGSRMAVQCLVEKGDPPIKVEWFHDHKLASETPGVSVTPLGQFISTLMINEVSTFHEGNYTCRASSVSSRSSTSHSAFLRVHVAPRWREEPKDVDVIKGQDSLLSCLAEGYPIPEISWRRAPSGASSQNSMFHDLRMQHSRVQTYSNGSLLLRAVSNEDEGAYLCEVSNGVGKGLSAIIALKVHASPSVSGDEKVEARRGDSVSLKCSALGDPPLSLTFSRDGHPVDPSNVRDNKMTPESPSNPVEKYGEYYLERVTPLDSGKYTCTATNPYGSESLIINFLVQDAPSVPRNLRSKEEKSRSVTMSWAQPDTPDAFISHFILLVKQMDASTNSVNWEKSGIRQVKVPNGQFSYELPELLPDTSYEIKVVAVNNVGQSPESEAIIVRTKGEAPSGTPQNIIATSISPKEVKVEWAAPDPSTWHGRILGYYIGHKKQSISSENFTFETAIVSSETIGGSWVVRGLQEYTPYVFVVRAFNYNGSGPISVEVHATTHEDVPKAPPNDFTCTALTSSRIEVIWSPPEQKQSNGKIMTYSVSYVPLTEDSPKPETRIVSDLRMTLGNLRPYTNYSITVAASTRAGLGVATDPLICSTEEDVPEQPSFIKVIVSGPTSVVVAWAQPRQSLGQLTKYTLFFQTEKDRSPKRRTVPAQTKWLEVTGLEEGKEVKLWMTASTRVGEGMPTRRVAAIPTKAVPAGIHGVNSDLSVAKGSDVLLPCPHSGYPAPQLTWKVNGLPFSSPNWSGKSGWSNQNDGSFLIRDLKKEDAGNFTCHVTNYHGADEVTYSLRVLVPPSAFRLRAVSSSAESLKVSWEEGSSGGSPITRLALTWRPASGEWREKILPWHLRTTTLHDLTCGTEHHLYLTAFNEIGPGEASDSITIRTKGNRPHSPAKNQILFLNLTTAILRLSSFTDPDCPTKEFYIRVKSTTMQHWSFESGSIQGATKEYILPNLTPKTKYLLEATATNDAGETKSHYSFYSSSDKDEEYEVLGGELTVPRWESDNGNLYADPAFIIPVIISCLALLVIAGAIGICCLKKPPASTTAIKSEEKSGHLSSWKEPSLYGTIRKGPMPMSTPDMKSIGDSSTYTDEIHPYATFQLKPYDDMSVTSSMQTYARASVVGQNCRNVIQDMDKKENSKNARSRARSLSRGSNYVRGKVGSDEYDYEESGYSDSDIDTLPSSKTSNYARSTYEPTAVIRSSHHNMLYVASDVSSIPSPEKERKSLTRKMKGRSTNSAFRRSGGHETPAPLLPQEISGEPRLAGQEIIRPNFSSSKNPIRYKDSDRLNYKSPDHKNIGKSDDCQNYNRGLKKLGSSSENLSLKPNSFRSSGSRDGLELSETECDRDAPHGRLLSKKQNFSIAV